MRRGENVQWMWRRDLLRWRATARRAKATRVRGLSAGPGSHGSTAARHGSSVTASVTGWCTRWWCHGSSTIWLGVRPTARLFVWCGVLTLSGHELASRLIKDGSITKIVLVVVLNVVSRRVHWPWSGIIEVLLVERPDSICPLLRVICGVIWWQGSKAHG